MRCVDCGATVSRVIGFERGIRRCYPCASNYREVPTNPRTVADNLSVVPISKGNVFDTAPTMDRIAAMFEGKE